MGSSELQLRSSAKHIINMMLTIEVELTTKAITVQLALTLHRCKRHANTETSMKARSRVKCPTGCCFGMAIALVTQPRGRCVLLPPQSLSLFPSLLCIQQCRTRKCRRHHRLRLDPSTSSASSLPSYPVPEVVPAPTPPHDRPSYCLDHLPVPKTILRHPRPQPVLEHYFVTLLVLGAQTIDVLADASFSIMTRPARPQDWEPFMYILHTHNTLERV